MTDGIPAPEKEPNAWGQALLALVLVGGLAVGAWLSLRTSAGHGGASAAPTCSESTAAPAAGHLTGEQLCRTLDRDDLAALLGTPSERPKSTSGSDSSVRPAGGTEIDTPEAKIEFDTYTVSLTATYDRLPVTGFVPLLGHDAEQRKVLGRPAVLYSDRTMSIVFRLDGSDSRPGPSVPARTLSVAQDAKDTGGSYELSLWREDGTVPDDAVLLRVADAVLPTLPGWTARS